MDIPATLDARLQWRLTNLRQQRAAVATELAAIDRSIAELEALTDPSRYAQPPAPETFPGTPEESHTDAK